MSDEKIIDIAEKIITQAGYALVKLTVIRGRTKNKIEVVIYSEKGIKHSDCSKVTRALLSNEDFEKMLGEDYVLEVSSPGVGRKLHSLREYKIFIGKEVEFFLKSEKNPTFGIIKKVEDNTLVLMKKQTGEEIRTDLQNIHYCKLSDKI